MIALLAGIKAKIIAAGLAVLAVLAFLAKVRRGGRAAERRDQQERARDAERRKDEVRDPGDSGTVDKLRNGRF